MMLSLLINLQTARGGAGVSDTMWFVKVIEFLMMLQTTTAWPKGRGLKVYLSEASAGARARRENAGVRKLP